MPLKLSSLRNEEKHPVAAGLIALAAVAVALGLVAGVFAFVASQAFGLGGDGGQQVAQAANQGASLYLPTPSPTASSSGALITLSPGSVTTSSTAADPATETPAQEVTKLTLSAGETKVGPMDRIDLTGVYPGGEGAVLQVQRRDGASGGWSDFAVTVGVSGEQFSTYVQTGHAGKQQWRVKDTDSGLTSNVVTVTIG